VHIEKHEKLVPQINQVIKLNIKTISFSAHSLDTVHVIMADILYIQECQNADLFIIYLIGNGSPLL
jgi:orotate phosphoribosyltransferase-like protein